MNKNWFTNGFVSWRGFRFCKLNNGMNVRRLDGTGGLVLLGDNIASNDQAAKLMEDFVARQGV